MLTLFHCYFQLPGLPVTPMEVLAESQQEALEEARRISGVTGARWMIAPYDSTQPL